jgi:hypothetical protein
MVLLLKEDMMRIERALRLRQGAINDLNGLISSAENFKYTSEKVNHRFGEILKRLNSVKSPLWITNYLEGMRDYWISTLYRYKLEFCYKVDGKLYSTHKASSRNYEACGFSPKQLYELQESSGHYWIDTDSPWSVSDKEDA